MSTIIQFDLPHTLRQAANDPRAWWESDDAFDDHERNIRAPSWAWVWFWGAVAWLVCSGVVAMLWGML